MNDHTTRRMYTKRAPGDINIYAMKEDLTTQELSKKEKENAKYRGLKIQIPHPSFLIFKISQSIVKFLN